MTIDEELMLNRVVDRYGEAMRLGMRPSVLELFDRMTPVARRELVIKQINKTVTE